MENKDYRNTPFGDSSLDIEKRLDWLIGELTPDEKFTLLSSASADIDRLEIKACGFGGEAAHGVEGRNDQNGLNSPDVSTSFPQPIGMSSSWDREAIKAAGEVTGREARVISHRPGRAGLSRWAPTVDLGRSPRWGRNEEGYGEDPVLTGEMASAYIRGMQGNDPKYIRIAATLKHFYANNVEFGRGRKNSTVDPRNKYEYYLEPFRRAIEDGGAEGVMSAYNRINGTQGLFNSEIRELLKDRFGLTHAVSDGGAMGLVAAYSHDNGMDAQTIARSVKAGVDAMSDDPALVEAAAREAYELGLMTEADMDTAIRNTFRTRLRLGVYDRENLNPYDRVTEADILSEENERICHELTDRSVVLLKNNGMLPLDKDSLKEKTVLIGPVADEWYQDWYGGKAPYRTTVRMGLEDVINEASAAESADSNAGEFRYSDKNFCDGRNVVRLCVDDKFLATDKEGKRLALSDDPEEFVMDEWGENAYTFRSVKTGKYISTHISDSEDAFGRGVSGEVYTDAEEIFSWFALETLHLEKKEDGTVILQNRFGDAFCTDEGGRICTPENPELAGEGRSTVLMGVNPGINEENQRETAKETVLSAPLSIKIEIVRNGISEARSMAKKAENVILVLGHNPIINAKEETDRESIDFIPYQQKLFDEVIGVNPNVAVVLLSDYPFAINDINEKAKAVLWSATGSQCMGRAVARSLIGENAPAGRLTQTWYKEDVDKGALIDDYDIINNPRTYRYFEKEVLYPFGYGLTYTDFEYSGMKAEVTDGTLIRVSLDVTNIGKVTSDEVVELYAKAPASRVKKPLRQLIAFERVRDIEPGETVTVEFEVSTEELRFYDVTRESLIVEEGHYLLFAGPDCLTEAVSAYVHVPGIKTGTRDLSKKIKSDHYDSQSGAQIVEGCFGFKALETLTPGEGFTAIYGDCVIPEGAENFRIHAIATGTSLIRVYADGVKICDFDGDTRDYELRPIRFRDSLPRAMADMNELKSSWKAIWADLRIKTGENLPCGRPCTIRIEAEGSIKFDWFEFV